MGVQPTVAITMGDAGGVGPELAAATLAHRGGELRAVAIGEPWVFERAAAVVAPELRFAPAASIDDARFAPGVVDVLRPPDAGLAEAPWGRSDVACGRAAGACLRSAYE